MKKYIIPVIAAFIFMSCNGGKNAVTGRAQSGFISEASMQQMALTEYKGFLDSSRVITGTANSDMVKRVGSRISNAITKYYTEQGKADALKGFAWEYNLVDSKEANAWCMPGGKIVVYTGILSLTQNENALAVVLGHEITHAVAEHGRERMSSEMKRQALGTILSVALSTKAPETRNIFLSAYDVGSQVGYALPHSRSQETEADHYGLLYCAMAGYDPQAAISFWQRMQALSNGQAPPEFLSDHPADANRIKDLQALMPEALKIYKQTGK